jgi:hypothetical protein
MQGGVACGGSATAPNGDVVVSFDFAETSHGFVAGFAEYREGADTSGNVSEYRPLAPPLDSTKNGLFISAGNGSDDLFMFYKGRVSG